MVDMQGKMDRCLAPCDAGHPGFDAAVKHVQYVYIMEYEWTDLFECCTSVNVYHLGLCHAWNHGQTSFHVDVLLLLLLLLGWVVVLVGEVACQFDREEHIPWVEDRDCLRVRGRASQRLDWEASGHIGQGKMWVGLGVEG